MALFSHLGSHALEQAKQNKKRKKSIFGQFQNRL
jgi:hypothetical protein